MTGYVSTTDCRTYTGLTSTDVSDNDLQSFINLASSMIVQDLSISIVDEQPSGNVNGTNKTFEVSKYPIADINGDGTVSVGDVIMYQWTDDDDPSTRSTLTVSTIYPRDGMVVLSSAPASTIQKITADYSYTLEDSIDWNLVGIACSYLTAYLFCIKKFTVIPESISRGPIRFRYYTKPYNEYLSKYNELMYLIKSTNHIKKTSNKMELERTEMD